MSARSAARLGIAALGLALALALGHDAAPAAGVVPQLGTVVFRGADGVVLSIDLDPLSPEAGAFAIGIDGGATYVAIDRAAIEPNGVRNLKVRYDGPVRVMAADAVSRVVAGRLTGEFLTDKGRAVATFEADGRRYRILAHGAPAEELTTVLPAFEAAMRVSDWSALYGLLAADVRQAMPAAEFIASASAQTAVIGHTADIRRLSVGAPAASPLGMSYAVARYEIARVRADGTRTTTAYDAYFLYEDAWRLWFTAQR